jgi:hypothetical protein
MKSWWGTVAVMLSQVVIAAPVETPIAERLERAEATWTSLRPESYSYRIREGGVFGYKTVHVRVNGGKCIRARSWRGLLPHAESCEGRTVPELLERIRKELPQTHNRTSRSASFDPCYGYPTEFTVSMGDDPPDQDWYFVVEGFRTSTAARCAPDKSFQPTSSSSLRSPTAAAELHR